MTASDNVTLAAVSPELEPNVEVVEGRLETDDVDGFLDSLDEVAERYGVAAQGFDARYLTSPRHVVHAAAKALRAFDRGEGVAEALAMELMLYVAGTRQISVATETGVRAGGCDAVVSLAPEPDAPVDEGVPEAAVEEVEDLLGSGDVDYLDRDVVEEFYDVSEDELDAVGERKLELLVLERVALLDVEK